MKQPGAWGLAILCMLLASQLSTCKARGIKHRFRWNRKPLPGTANVPEARVAENHSGVFIRQGRKLDIDFGPEGNEYYEAHYWQFPDGVHYDGCSDANVTRDVFVAGCINATQAANQAELSGQVQRQVQVLGQVQVQGQGQGQDQGQEQQLRQRILWRLIQELCASKRCQFWLGRGAGSQLAGDQHVVLGLLAVICLIVT